MITYELIIKLVV